jgi:hypothetical protein
MPPAYIKPYVKRGKNEAVDAAAVCEAMSRPGMRFVPIKSADQQAVLMLHKTRELLIKQRTMSVNALAQPSGGAWSDGRQGHQPHRGVARTCGSRRVDAERGERDREALGLASRRA